MIRWRATAYRWSFDGDGDWYGRWRSHRAALAQATGWASRDDVVNVWLEAGAEGVGIVLTVELRSPRTAG